MPAFGGESLFGAFHASMLENLANFPQASNTAANGMMLQMASILPTNSIVPLLATTWKRCLDLAGSCLCKDGVPSAESLAPVLQPPPF